MNIRIDPEFKNLIPPLTREEYEQLEKNIVSEGCREPLTTWDGFIIDGHNRYEICQKHGIEFKVSEKAFESREDVKVWIINNQLGRRNLSEFVRFELMQKAKEILLQKGKEKQGHGQTAPGKTLLSITDKSVAHNTQKEIAEKLKWSTGKVAQAEVIIKKAPEEIKDQK